MPIYSGDIEKVDPAKIQKGDFLLVDYPYQRVDTPWMTVKDIAITKHDVYHFKCETLDSVSHKKRRGRRSTAKVAG